MHWQRATVRGNRDSTLAAASRRSTIPAVAAAPRRFSGRPWQGGPSLGIWTRRAIWDGQPPSGRPFGGWRLRVAPLTPAASADQRSLARLVVLVCAAPGAGAGGRCGSCALVPVAIAALPRLQHRDGAPHGRGHGVRPWRRAARLRLSAQVVRAGGRASCLRVPSMAAGMGEALLQPVSPAAQDVPQARWHRPRVRAAG